MKMAGIIGGIAPASTIEYYRLIISGFRERTNTKEYPRILINSINMTRMLDLVEHSKFDELTDVLSSEIKRLEAGGADFAALASNTPHIIFEQLRKKADIPLISIVEETCKKARVSGCKKAGLFGTKFTMQGGFYQKVFAHSGIDIQIPDSRAREYIHDIYMNELVNGIFLENTKTRLVQIAESMRNTAGIDAVILGGTELPLILKESDLNGLAVLNTTQIHVESLIEFMLLG